MRHQTFSEGSVRFRLFLLGVAVCFAASACSSSEAVESGDPSLVVAITDSEITIENQTGVSLSKGEVMIMPVGMPRPYVMNFSFTSSGQTRRFPLNSFRQTDGTPFRRGVANGKSVRVVATDVTGKELIREVPFE
jgi:hypothetical protein